MTAILQVRGLVKRFGGLPAVDGLDFDVDAGEVFAIIGPNGAGKSTLLKMVSGLLRPSAGTVLFDGTDITGRKPHQVRRAGLAKVLQTPRAFETMTVLENAALGAIFGGRDGRSQSQALDAGAEVLDLLGLCGKSGHAVATLNLHEKRTLELARALAGRPRVLLLDEVMAGLNPAEVDTYVGVVAEVRDNLGMTVVWVEHVMRAITALADQVHVMHFGRTLAAGTAADVLREPAVIEAYLGRGAGSSAAG